MSKSKQSKLNKDFEIFWHNEYRHVNNIVKEIARTAWLNGAYKVVEAQQESTIKYLKVDK